MYLTDEEEKMYNGEYGVVLQKAIKSLIKVGEILGAERLIKVAHAHVSGVSYFNIGDAGLMFLESIASSGVKFKSFTTANPYAVIQGFRGRRFSKEVLDKQMQIIRFLAIMGAKYFTCAPYYIRPPKRGEHLAWAESNAVLYANSIAGAYTNREGGPLALFEALTGRTYLGGVHLLEGRLPRCKVSVVPPKSYLEASLIGYMAGEMCPDRIPYVNGISSSTDVSMLRAFLAAFGATSGAPMVVMEGITPGYKELLVKSDITEHIVIDEKSLGQEKKALIERGKKMLFILGCPHLSNNEVSEIIKYLLLKLKGKGGCLKNAEKELWLITGPYTKIPSGASQLNRYGVKILFNVCPVVTRLDFLGIDLVVTDSGKAMFYIPKLAKVPVFIMDRWKLLDEFCRC